MRVRVAWERVRLHGSRCISWERMHLCGTVVSLLLRLAVWEVEVRASPCEMGAGASPREGAVSLLLGLTIWEVGTGVSPRGEVVSLLPRVTVCLLYILSVCCISM